MPDTAFKIKQSKTIESSIREFADRTGFDKYYPQLAMSLLRDLREADPKQKSLKPGIARDAASVIELDSKGARKIHYLVIMAGMEDVWTHISPVINYLGTGLSHFKDMEKFFNGYSVEAKRASYEVSKFVQDSGDVSRVRGLTYRIQDRIFEHRRGKLWAIIKSSGDSIIDTKNYGPYIREGEFLKNPEDIDVINRSMTPKLQLLTFLTSYLGGRTFLDELRPAVKYLNTTEERGYQSEAALLFDYESRLVKQMIQRDSERNVLKALVLYTGEMVLAGEKYKERKSNAESALRK